MRVVVRDTQPISRMEVLDLFWACGVLVPERNVFVQILCNRYCHSADLDACADIELVCILWSLARNHCNHAATVDAVVRRVTRVLPDILPEAFAMFLWSLMMLNYADRATIALCALHVPAVVHSTTAWTDIATVMCVLARYNVDDRAAAFRTDRLDYGGPGATSLCRPAVALCGVSMSYAP